MGQEVKDMIAALNKLGATVVVDYAHMCGGGSLEISPSMIPEYVADPEKVIAAALGFESVQQYKSWVEDEGTVHCHCGNCVTGHMQLEVKTYIQALKDPRCPRHGGTVLCDDLSCYRHHGKKKKAKAA